MPVWNLNASITPKGETPKNRTADRSPNVWGHPLGPDTTRKSRIYLRVSWKWNVVARKSRPSPRAPGIRVETRETTFSTQNRETKKTYRGSQEICRFWIRDNSCLKLSWSSPRLETCPGVELRIAPLHTWGRSGQPDNKNEFFWKINSPEQLYLALCGPSPAGLWFCCPLHPLRSRLRRALKWIISE